MQDVDDRLRRAGAALAERIDGSAAFERVEARRETGVGRSPRVRVVALVAAVVVAAAAGSWALTEVFTGSGSRSTHRPTVVPTTSGSTPPSSGDVPAAGQLLETVPFEADEMVPVDGSVFAMILALEGDRSVTVARIGPDGSVVRKGIFLDNAAWYAQFAASADAMYLGSTDRLIRIDGTSLTPTASILIHTIMRMTVVDRNLYVALDQRLLRLDPATLETLASVRLLNRAPTDVVGVSTPALGPGGLWVLSGPAPGQQDLVRMDPLTLRVLSRTPVPASDAIFNDVVANAGSIWLVGTGTGVWPVDPSGSVRGSPIDIPDLSNAYAWEGGLVALVQPRALSMLELIDQDGRIVGRTELSGDVSGWFAVEGRDAWLRTAGLTHVRLGTAQP